MKSVFHEQMQMLARHVVRLDPVTTAVLNQLLVQESIIKVVSSLQLLIKKTETCTFVFGNEKWGLPAYQAACHARKCHGHKHSNVSQCVL